MTVGAWNRNVRTLKREARVAVFVDRETGAVPVLDRMTIFAAVVVWSCGELTIVRILVTIGTSSELHLVQRLFARGDVALAAVHLCVFSL